MNDRDGNPEWGPKSQEPPAPPRSGTEPLTARSDLPLRLVLSLIFAPLFTLLTAGLVVWWVTSGGGDSPHPDELRLLMLALGVLTVISWLDLYIVGRRMRQQRRHLTDP